MRNIFWAMLIVVGTATTAGLAQRAEWASNDAPELALKTAINRELIDGDLPAAIKRYTEIIDRHRATSPAVAAKALLQIARAYEKLGSTDASATYQRILRDFPQEQRVVSIARTRLGAQSSGPVTPGLTTRRVLAQGEAYTRISPDGRYLARTDHSTGNLVLFDLATQQSRPVIADGRPDDPDHRFSLTSAFSRDGKQIAYQWYTEIDDRSVVRVVSTAGPSPGTPRTIYDNRDVDFALTDWSPDGKWLAGLARRKDRTSQIAVISVADGSLKVLKTVDWSHVGGLRFNASSTQLAYHRPQQEGSFERDVFLIALDGSSEQPVVASPGDDTVLEWTADGQRLLVASDRGGSMSVWSVTPGQSAAAALELVKSDVGIISSLGPTRDDTLFYNVLPATANIYVADFDASSGRLTSEPRQVVTQFKGFNASPEWSPDGKLLAYASRRHVPAPINAGRVVIPVLSVDDGRIERELIPQLSYSLGTGRWSVDGRHFLTYGADLKGRGSLITIDASSGEPRLIVANETCGGFPQWAADGASFFCYRAPDFNKSAKSEIVQVHATSGEVMRAYAAEGQNSAVSPDGRYVIHGPGLKLLTLATGESRDLVKFVAPSRPGNLNARDWTNDSRGLAFWGVVNGEAGMWLVSIDGSAAKKINVNVSGEIFHWRFNRKTGQVAFSTDNQVGNRLELWKMENFVSSTRR